MVFGVTLRIHFVSQILMEDYTYKFIWKLGILSIQETIKITRH